MIDQVIPWAASTIRPSELKTLKDMTPEELEVARKSGIQWGKRGLARFDHCQRCGRRYSELMPGCVNKAEHEEGAARLAAESSLSLEELDCESLVRR